MARIVQLSTGSGNSIQNMTKEEQRENIRILPDLLLNNPEELKYVDKDLLKEHDELYLAAVSTDQFAIADVPFDVQERHPEMSLSAIKRTPTLLKHIPETIMKDNLHVLETCAFNVGSCIEFIPREVAVLSGTIYDNAVRSDGMSLEYIPPDIQLQRPRLAVEALKETPACAEFVNPELYETSPEVCMAAVRSDGMNLSMIPYRMQEENPRIAEEAIGKNRSAVIYASPSFQEKNLGLLRNALRHHPDRVEEMDWGFLSAHPDLIEVVVGKDGLLLELFPEDYLEAHPKIVDRAIRENGAALYFISASMQDKASDAITFALSKNAYILPQIHKDALLHHPEFTVQFRRSRAISLPEVAAQEMAKLREGADPDCNDILICLEIDPCETVGILQEKKRDIGSDLNRILNGNVLSHLPSREKILFVIDRLSSLTKSGFLPKAPVLDVLLRLPKEKFDAFDKKKWFRIAQNPIWERDPVTLRSLMLLSFAAGMYEPDPRLSSKGQSFLESITRMRGIFTINAPKKKEESISEEIKELLQNAVTSGILEVTKEPYRLKLNHSAQRKAAANIAINIWRENYSKMILKGKSGSNSTKENALKKLKNTIQEDIRQAHFPETVYASEKEEIFQAEDSFKSAYGRAILLGMYRQEDEETIICRVKPNLSRKQNTELCVLLNKIPQHLLTYNGITANRLHQMADSMQPEYASSLAAFLSGHREKLLEYGCDISYIQRVFPSASRRYMDDARHHMRKGHLIPPEKMTFKELIRYTTPGKYQPPQGIDPEVIFNASFVSNLYNYSQSGFEKVCDLAQQAANRTESSIPQVEGSCGAYRYKVIPLSDISALQFGMKLSCCQQLSGAGESCMIHSMTSVNGRVLYLYDSDERAVYGSWIWRNGEVLCADNIEGRSRTIGGDQVIQEDVMECYRDWAKKEIAASQETETNSRGILRVTFGSGYSDLSTAGFEPDSENRYPLEQVAYIHDSRSQFVIAKADEDVIQEKRHFADETPCIYKDNPEITPMFQPEVAETSAYASHGESKRESEISEAQQYLHMTDMEDPAYPGMPTVQTDHQLYVFKRTCEFLERTGTARIQEKEETRLAKKEQKTRG